MRHSTASKKPKNIMTKSVSSDKINFSKIIVFDTIIIENFIKILTDNDHEGFLKLVISKVPSSVKIHCKNPFYFEFIKKITRQRCLKVFLNEQNTELSMVHYLELTYNKEENITTEEKNITNITTNNNTKEENDIKEKNISDPIISYLNNLEFFKVSTNEDVIFEFLYKSYYSATFIKWLKLAKNNLR
jgi:hypothetical protein